jgi:hypothetical protein
MHLNRHLLVVSFGIVVTLAILGWWGVYSQ